MVGLGYLIIPGAGLHFTMAVGITIIHMVGFGFQIINGVLPGLRGEEPVAIMAGHLCVQVSASA